MDRASLARADRERIMFAEAVCGRREEMGMSQHEAARLAEIPERGWRRDPSAVILSRMAGALGLRLELVLAG